MFSYCLKNDLFEVAKADILDEIAGLAYHKKIEPAEWSVVCFIKNTDILTIIFGGKFIFQSSIQNLSYVLQVVLFFQAKSIPKCFLPGVVCCFYI